MSKKQNKNIFETILNVFAWFVFFISLITTALTIFASASDEKDGKEIFGFKFLIVASNSMQKSLLSENEPIYFNAGDIVVIKTATNATSYQIGDVISFISHNPDSFGKTLTHKIKNINISKAGNVVSYTTYGIYTGVNDKAVVVPDTIIGKYVNKIPNLGKIFSYLKTPTGYYISILTPSVLLIIFFSITVGKYIGKKAALVEQGDTQQFSVANSQEFEKLCNRVYLLENELKLLVTPNIVE